MAGMRVKGYFKQKESIRELDPGHGSFIAKET